MSFIGTMAWRDTRASRRRLLFFSLSIALGIAALVAIGSFGDNLRQAVDDQANGLLGADLMVILRAEPDPALVHFLAGLHAEQARERDSGALLTFLSGRTEPRLVQVRALAGNYPFYGTFAAEPADAIARLRAGGEVAIVDAALMAMSGTRVGDPIRVGKKTYTVIGALDDFPGEPQVLTEMAPPVLVPFSADVKPEGTVTPDTRLYLRLPPGADVAGVERQLRQGKWPGVLMVASAEERKRSVAEAVTAIDQFFCLVGFIALFLGSIGLASTTHAYVSQKLNTVAILRCLGASASQAFLVYLLQGAVLGLFGAVVGAALGVAVQLSLPSLVRDFIPFPVTASLVWTPIATGMVAGLIVCLLFTVLPLLRVRRIPPLAALRAAVTPSGNGAHDPWRSVVFGAIGAAVLGFAHWETGSWPYAIGYAAMLAFSLAVFAGTARLVSAAARRWLPAGLPYVARQGIANLYRPNNRTTLLLVSLGLGTFLVLTLYLTRSSFLHQFSFDERPNLVLSAVPEDHMQEVSQLIQTQGGKVIDCLPVIDLKALTINGEPAAAALDKRLPPRPRGRGRPAPDFSIVATYRDRLPEGEHVTDGHFTARAEPGAPIIPISVNLGPNWHLKVGDRVVWDLGGIPITTEVGSVRRADAPPFTMAREFPVIFPLGAVEGAPKQFLITARAPTPAISKAICQAVAAADPAVNTLDVATMVGAFEKVFRKVALIVEFMALFTVATGVIMLAAAVVTGSYQRVRETVLLRTLGASRRQLRQIQFFEYAVLGILAAAVGCLLALAANGLLTHFVFKFPKYFSGEEVGIAMVAVPLVTLVTGLLADRGTLSRPPLEVLRQET